MHFFKSLALAVAVSAALIAASQPLSAADASSASFKFLTGPQAGDQDALALSYLAGQRAAIGLTELDLLGMIRKDDYRSEHNGIRHLYWRQQHDGIEVWNGDLAINVARDGSIINLHNAFVSDLAGKVARTTPEISAPAAITAAAAELGLAMRFPLQLLKAEGGAERKATYSGAGLSADEIPVRLIYQPSPDRSSVRLAWDLVIRETSGANWWSMRVDAETGEVISRANWVSHAAAKGGSSYVYRVFPYPSENPDQSAHALDSNPHDALASPFGWHDINGIAGDDFTDTRGNNVNAQEDQDNNDVGGSRPTASPLSPLTFDATFNPLADPAAGSNVNASIINLFYWNNIMHDVSYQYGFNEAAGNFQFNNYGNGGVGADPVSADSLDGSSTNNANFGTPPDGLAPRMQMFRWLPPAIIDVTVNTPPIIAATYGGVAAAFGSAFPGAGITIDLQLVNDGSGVGSDSCQASPAGSLTGKTAVLDRGVCEFGLKVLNAQNAGATSAIVVNNNGGTPILMAPGDFGGSVTIPSLMLSLADGDLIKSQLPTPGVNATIVPRVVTAEDRDSDYDNGVIAHEYGHGISNRLTGGPSNSSCLLTGTAPNQSEQAGEGWSDFWALVLHAKPADTATTARTIGTYLNYEAASGFGIRNFRYSTDPLVSPQTYANVAATNAPHGVGEIWAGALWNMYWHLVHRYGYDPDLYTGSGGNNLTIQLVVDGMKLQPCSPTMVQARDAILAADLANNSGANSCEIWRAFAAKGLGQGAVGGTFQRGDEIASSAIPAACNLVFGDGFE